DAGHGTGRIVFQTEDGEPFNAGQREQIGEALAAAEESPGVDGVLNPFTAQDQREAQERQLADGRAQAADGRAQLDAAEETLDENQARLDAAREQAERADAPDQVLDELDDRQAALDDGRAELERNREQLADGLPELDRGERMMALSEETRTVSADGITAMAVVTFPAE